MTATGYFRTAGSGNAGSAGPVRYDVDPAQVGALATGLRRVQSTVHGIGRLDATETTDLGAPSVADALGDLGRSWSIARRSLLEELDGLAHAAELAARAYAMVDGNALTALGGSAGSASRAGTAGTPR